jgi:DNA processing protein
MSIPILSNVNKLTLEQENIPDILLHIPSPPKELHVAGSPLKDILDRPRVAIVGSRKISAYGREVTTKLAYDLAARGVVIISGLALGVDGLAHKAALEAGGTTVAVLPTPLEHVYPSTHRQLAQQILDAGGTLISEYPDATPFNLSTFIARNRLVSGLAQAVLITEAAEKSGSLHTARFALEQGRDVLAVPGSIFSTTSAGTNNLIKTGATPVTDYSDVLHILKIEEPGRPDKQPHGANTTEQLILGLIFEGVRDSDMLLAGSNLSVTEFNQTLTMLEITGKVRPLGGGQWTLS